MENFKQIDVHQAKEMMDKGDVTIVDIRDPDSFQSAHIADAIAVTDQNIQSFLATGDKDKPLICYCYRGFSSQDAAEYFAKSGFKEVYSIEGGFEKWQTAYPFVSSP